MIEFIRKFTQLNGRTATIILKHELFGKQQCETQEVNVFEDEDRLGLILHQQPVYVYKHRLRLIELRDGIVECADDKLKISIIF